MCACECACECAYVCYAGTTSLSTLFFPPFFPMLEALHYHPKAVSCFSVARWALSLSSTGSLAGAPRRPGWAGESAR